jgi:hypothetical protein
MTFSELDLFIVKFLWAMILTLITWILAWLGIRIEIKIRKDKLELEQWELAVKKK